MSLKYEVLKRLVKASGIKKRWVGQSTEELLEGRRRQNAKNRIPEMKDDAFTISYQKGPAFRQRDGAGSLCPVLPALHGLSHYQSLRDDPRDLSGDAA